jgi:hypothetical protein
MAYYRLKVEDFPARLHADLLAKREKVVRGLRQGAWRGISHIHEAIVRSEPYPPQDTGRYTASWSVEDEVDGATIYNPVLYARIIEEGRNPGRWPPRKAIERWARRKFGPEEGRRIAFLVQRKIGQQGTPGKWVLRRAWPKIVRSALAEVLRSLEGD